MTEKYIETLELDKVLKMLSNEASIDATKKIAENIKPVSDLNTVIGLIKNTEAAYTLAARYASPSFGKISDADSIFEITEVCGMLNCGELLKLAEILSVIRSVKQWKENSAETKTSIDAYFDALTPNKYFEDKIRLYINEDETVSDAASKVLYDIRRRISSSTENIRSKLDKIVKNFAKNKYLQEAIVTQRDGRFVVPVKNEYRLEIPGIVHDTSASGATLFVEPAVVVEINNEIRVLKAKEKEEIERIIAELSSEAAQFSSSIYSSYQILIKIDLLFAKASLAYKMKANVPAINADGDIYLKNARHPLIPASLVVPITVELGKQYSTLVVTGPNTGGKTVSLKTVGLLTLMTMCGLMIPIDDSSRISVFDKILVDIGDKQSIEQSLSTFSSHMVNIVSMLNASDNNSLVLIDELGAGTDPIEGAALAKAILIDFKNSGAKIMATTHYADLKAYAINTQGVENACCDFDIETMKPTYKFLIGIPGRSNAFAISEKLGLSADTISNAKSYLTEDDIRFENLAKSLDVARKSAEKDREEISKLKRELIEKKQKIDSELSDLEAKRVKIVNKAREDSVRLLNDVRIKSNILLNTLEDMKRQINSENASKTLKEAKSSVKRSIDEFENTLNPVENRTNDDYVLPRPLKVGDTVNIFDINKNGTVTKIKGNFVYCAVGSINMKSDIKNIRLIQRPKPEIMKTRSIKGIQSRAERNVKSEIDIRGMNSEEGVMAVEKYLDDAVLNGLKTVTVIHGKGTGTLRSAVHSFLKTQKYVDSYRLGTFGEGEMGVTVISLKD